MHPLPEFEKPPISEVAISVEFSPLEKWTESYGGLYWGHIKADYPRTETKPPLPSQTESPDITFVDQPIRLSFGEPFQQRFWFLNDVGDRLVQVQHNRFVSNWRKVKGDEVYPRYDAELRPRFRTEWQRFKDFVTSESLGVIDVTQCELTYVNDFTQGQEWERFAESMALFAHWVNKGSVGFLPQLETFNMNGSFQISNGNGRLHFASRHLLRQIDRKQVVQLRLTARGKPDTGEDSSILEWFDLAREWIVRGFADLTSDSAHALWKRRQ